MGRGTKGGTGGMCDCELAVPSWVVLEKDLTDRSSEGREAFSAVVPLDVAKEFTDGVIPFEGRRGDMIGVEAGIEWSCPDADVDRVGVKDSFLAIFAAIPRSPV